ncbi:fibronectin type III domain-containing protein [Luedemannella helvata]|uniref:Fibronectin type III domain-containing protein n=1 Tax=Luedemannella helvata TaxID=349315 RepID=A0ABP4WK47_9ACTN
MKFHHPGRRLAALVVGALGAGLLAAPAAASTALPTPGTPVATTVTTTSITITWAASAGPVADYTVQFIEGRTAWRDLATTGATTFTHHGLTPDKVYEYRIVANPVAGSGYTTSAPSGYIFVTTAPLPDTVAPTAPGTLMALSVTTVSATISTTAAATDNNRVAAYWVQREVDGVWTDWATNNITSVYLRDLQPATSYTVAMVAVDPNGNRSPRSAPLTFTTRAATPAPTCRVQLTTFGQQYMLSVIVENMTAATVLANWTVTFTLPATHTINSSFGGAPVTRVGTQATATPAAYQATLNPGGTAQFGLFATYPAGSGLPSGFALNGAGLAPAACTTA